MRCCLRSLVLVLLISATTFAANYGSVAIQVVGPEGDPVPNADVVLRSEATLSPVTAVTERDGSALFLKLPPGAYAVSVNGTELMGGDRALDVEQNTVTELTLTVPEARFDGEVSVIGEPVTASSFVTSVSEHYRLRELEPLPVSREYRAYAQLAAGVNVVPNSDGLETRYEPASKAGNNYHDRGADMGSRDNVYYLDGFNITGMAGGTAAFTLHNSVISELEVITSGVPAEYGGGAGYVANLATKDGGPTLTGAAELYLRRSGMYESFDTDDPRLQAVTQDKYDAGVTLGGPLVRERLWFFAAGQLRSNTSDVELSPSASPTSRTTSYDLERHALFGKLRWQAAPTTSISAAVYDEPQETTGSRNVNIPPNRYSRTEQDSTLGSVTAEHMPSDRLLLEARLAHHRDSFKRVPQHPDAGPTNTIRFPPGVSVPAYERLLGSSGNGGQTTREKLQADLAATTYFEAAGSHQLKVGLEFLRWEEANGASLVFPRSLVSLAPSLVGLTFAEARDLDLLPSSEYDFIYRVLQESPESSAFAFADRNGDGTVSPAEFASLTFSSTQGNAGGINFLANELLHAGVNNVIQENVIGYVQDAWRLGDWAVSAGVRVEQLRYVASDGSTILSMDPELYPRLGISRRLDRNGRHRLTFAYGTYSDLLMSPMIRFAGNLSGSVNADQVFIGDEWFTYRVRGSKVLNRDAGFAPNLENETETEYQLTYEGRLAPNLRLTAQAYYRRDRNLIEDYNPNVYFNPDVAGDLVLEPGDFGYPEGGPQDVNYFLGNLVGGKRRAWGLDLSLQRRFSDRWTATLQYSYTDAEGNSNSNAAADLQGDFVDLDPRQPYMWGDLPGTIPHQVKLYGSYTFDFGLDAGVLAYWSSGAVFTEADIFRPTSYNIYYNHQRDDGSYVTTGQRQHPAYATVDLKLRYTWPVLGNLEASVILDVLNALDNQDAIRITEAHNHPEFTTFGENRLLLEPRRYQVGVVISW